MNPRSNPAKYLFVFWLCLFSLIDLRSLQGLVVCFGTDGHVAVETSLDGDHCKSLSGLAMQGRVEVDSKATHCGECRDIRVDAPSLNAAPSSRSASVPKLNAPALDLLNGFGFSDPAALIAKDFPSASHSGDLALLSTRSTVLRI